MKRNTVQKSLVLKAVNTLHNHPDADDIYDEVVKSHSSVSRATVYRNLNRLCEEGALKRLEMPIGADRFDHRTHGHYHLKCGVCEKVFDVQMEYMEDIDHKVTDKQGFIFSSHILTFTGICPKCQENDSTMGYSGLKNSTNT